MQLSEEERLFRRRNSVRKWAKANPEKRKAIARRYYLKHSKQVIAKAAKWRDANRERARRNWRNSRLKRELGIGIEEYQTLFVAQHGCCAICKKVQTSNLDVDHNHQTKTIRGLLCRSCNTALGSFRESPELLQEAIKYLMKFSA